MRFSVQSFISEFTAVMLSDYNTELLTDGVTDGYGGSWNQQRKERLGYGLYSSSYT